MRHLWFSAVFLMFLGNLQAQVPFEYSAPVFFSPSDSQKLVLHIGDKNFFKNNEYFNPLNEGMTLPGVLFEPTMVYRPGPYTRLEVGGSFLKYFGRNGIYIAQPLIRFQYQPAPFFQMVMGSIYGGSMHGLIEPLYQWEQTFRHPVEDGLQFLFKTPRLHSDTWLEWIRFIVPGDMFQEQLTFGTTFSYRFTPDDSRFGFSVPFQTTINHHGGQIDSIDKPLRTIANYATGFNSSYVTGNSTIQLLRLDCWVIGYNDLSPQKQQPYSSGYAFYSKLGVKIRSFSVEPGYFYGYRFISSEGEPLFLSATLPFNGVKEPERHLITGKLIFSKHIQKGVSLAAYYEMYKDLKASNTDYDYGVHIIFDTDFFLAKLK